MPRPFHLAIPVDNLKRCSEFYIDTLGCETGRSAEEWIDLNLFGHQLVLHVDPNHQGHKHHNEVDGKSVPIPHFGVLLEWEEFKNFEQRLREKKIEFVIEPYLRFKDLPGEQMTLFFYDPAGNALEFKAFKNDEQIFAN
jgi:extradiol dioxygenase family protein